MRYPPSILDDIRARLPVSQVVARKVALKKAGREFRGLSPFKVEKTPSFFVNDQKGFYHCFASGEHGDIFKFLMTTEGLSFPEAVQRLAEEAGVTLPKPAERDAEREDERTRLYALLEQAARFFEANLKDAAGTQARQYVHEKRGLRRETVAEFRLGYAPAGRNALKAHLAKAGFSEAEMVRSGMLIGGEDIPSPYDRFRHRVMFPITDLKARVIAFGGRALDPDAPAKYLNSPETPLFHKGSILFNAARARPLAHDRGRIIAVEGYMDVVALAEAGFGDAVAPLGTALTEDQVKLLWRFVPEPILCFDGDTAGQKAANRAVDTVLPHLMPGRSIAFAFLPNGLDPDDLIRQQGALAMDAVLKRLRPLADMLWDREWSAGDWSTPERRAQLELRLNELVGRIADPGVREHYRQAMRTRLAQAWGQRRADDRRPYPARGAQRPGPVTGRRGPSTQGGFAGGRGGLPRGGPAGAFAPPPGASSSLQRSAMVAGQEAVPPYREAVLLLALLNHPGLLERYAEDVATLELTSPALKKLRDALLLLQSSENSLDRACLRAHLTRLSLDKVVDLVERAVTHKSDKFAEPGTVEAEVDAGWRHALALHDRQTGHRKALEAAERTWHLEQSDEAYARIREIKQLMASSELLEASSDS